MWFLDKLLGKDKICIKSYKRGIVSANQIQVNYNNIDSIKKRFIAFDVETTGLDSSYDRIIEVAAILFENGVPVKKYATLVNAKVNVPYSASSVNHITNEMVKKAPSEDEVYTKLIDFFGDALQEQTVICAHNAKFDISFLSETLMRLGYSAKINYVDTLSLSRYLIKGLFNYKLKTVASYFNLKNLNEHRAEGDAEVCGSIFQKLLFILDGKLKHNKIFIENRKPSEEEMEVYAVIQNMILSRNGNVDLLGFYKNSSGYVDVYYLHNIIKFKFAKKGKYIIVDRNLIGIHNFTKEPCTMTEGGYEFIRVFFNSPLELKVLDDYIFQKYMDARNSVLEYISYNDNFLLEYKNSIIMNNALSTCDLKNILSTVYNKDYGINNIRENIEIADMTDLEINPINNRVPISEILNLNSWDKGFEMGFPFWKKGEDFRKSGNIEKAIVLYDKARFYGYCAPVLFESYAIAFHKIKDYGNEIDILDEGIERERKQGTNISKLITRRANAINLLRKIRKKEETIKEKDKKLKEKEQKKKEQQKNVMELILDKHKINKSNTEDTLKKYNCNKNGRPILQMDDDMNIIEQYDSVAEAVRITGINSKSIRDAAKGVQKHAGFFVWRYADDYDKED